MAVLLARRFFDAPHRVVQGSGSVGFDDFAIRFTQLSEFRGGRGKRGYRFGWDESFATQKWGNLLTCGAELTGMGPGVNEDVWCAASFFEPVDGEGKCLLGWHAGVT